MFKKENHTETDTHKQSAISTTQLDIFIGPSEKYSSQWKCMFQKLSAFFKTCSLLDLSKIREIKHLFSRGSSTDEEIGPFKILLSVKRHIFHLRVNQRPVSDAVKWFEYLRSYDYFSAHIKNTVRYTLLPSLRLTGADQVWCIVTILRDCSQHKSRIMLYYITLHLLTKKPPSHPVFGNLQAQFTPGSTSPPHSSSAQLH